MHGEGDLTVTVRVSKLGWHFTDFDHAVVSPYFVNDV